MNECDIDIVARLRAVLHDDRGVELMNREAADEIERLRKELVSITYRLTAERDEARRIYCRYRGFLQLKEPRDVAAEQGWDCFKENTND